MTIGTDFDFKIGRGHYRGRGWRALVALTIVHLPRAALIGGGGFSLYSGLPWLMKALHVSLVGQ